MFSNLLFQRRSFGSPLGLLGRMFCKLDRGGFRRFLFLWDLGSCIFCMACDSMVGEFIK